MRPVFCSMCGAPICRAHYKGCGDFTYVCHNCHTMVRITAWESDFHGMTITPRYDVEYMIYRRIKDLYMVEYYG